MWAVILLIAIFLLWIAVAAGLALFGGFLEHKVQSNPKTPKGSKKILFGSYITDK